MTDSDSGVDAFGRTRDELLQSIYENIDAIWFNFACPGDCPLDEEAQRIGLWWREHATVQKEGQ